MRHLIVSTWLVTLTMLLSCGCYSAGSQLAPGDTKVAQEKKVNLASFPDNESTRKIIKRNEIENEGWFLAKQGRYEEALDKYKLAMDPSLLNIESDKSYALCAMRKIYRCQGKLDDALALQEKYILVLNPKKEEFIEARLELLALIKARDTKNNKPVYDYINYLKAKDRAAGYGPDSHADDLIHLYDYLRDYDAGIAFMDELIKYHTTHKDPNHRSANAKHVKEYTRVKQAWELDKKTGRHGHLQDVIRTSDIISW